MAWWQTLSVLQVTYNAHGAESIAQGDYNHQLSVISKHERNFLVTTILFYSNTSIMSGVEG